MLPKILRLDVHLQDDRIVQQLRQENADLKARLRLLQEQFDRAEFLLRCEYTVNQQLTDYCAEHDFQFPKRLFQPKPINPDSSGS